MSESLHLLNGGVGTSSFRRLRAACNELDESIIEKVLELTASLCEVYEIFVNIHVLSFRSSFVR